MSSGPQRLTTDEYLRQFHHITPNHHGYAAIRDTLKGADRAVQHASNMSGPDAALETGMKSMEAGKKGLGQAYTQQAQMMYHDYFDKCDPLGWKAGSQAGQTLNADRTMEAKEPQQQVNAEPDEASKPMKTDGSQLERQLVGGEFRFIDTAPKDYSDPIGVPDADRMAKNIDEVHAFAQPDTQTPTELSGHGTPDAAIGQMAPKPNVFESTPNPEPEPTPSSPVQTMNEDHSLRMQLDLQGAKNEFNHPHNSPTSQFSGMSAHRMFENDHLYAAPKDHMSMSLQQGPSPSLDKRSELDDSFAPSMPQPHSGNRTRHMQQHLSL